MEILEGVDVERDTGAGYFAPPGRSVPGSAHAPLGRRCGGSRSQTSAPSRTGLARGAVVGGDDDRRRRWRVATASPCLGRDHRLIGRPDGDRRRAASSGRGRPRPRASSPCPRATVSFRSTTTSARRSGAVVGERTPHDPRSQPGAGDRVERPSRSAGGRGTSSSSLWSGPAKREPEPPASRTPTRRTPGSTAPGVVTSSVLPPRRLQNDDEVVANRRNVAVPLQPRFALRSHTDVRRDTSTGAFVGRSAGRRRAGGDASAPAPVRRCALGSYPEVS